MSQPAYIVTKPATIETIPTMVRYGRTKSGGETGTMFATSSAPCARIKSPPTIARKDMFSLKWESQNVVMKIRGP